MAETNRQLRVLVWHVHGSWTSAFVRGRHHYLLPTLPEGGPWGLGRAGRPWPDRAREVPAEQLGDLDVDVVVLQRPEEIDVAERWLGRRPGRDVPAVYVEHNTPRGHAATSRHPLAEQTAIPVAHVTHFNDLMWDCGRCPTTVIPHGIVDPGARYTGELPHVVAMINEPVRRWRITGTDLLPSFAEIAPVDVYGIGVDRLAGELPPAAHPVRGIADLDQRTLHDEVARRRVYVHTARWTSLGLSLLEAMHLGMPVVAVAATEAGAAVPAEAGVLSTDVTELTSAVRRFVHEPDLAAVTGKAAREYALTHFGLDAFLRHWDVLLSEVVR
ncbi:Glycosyl transferases group 1 [Amycolatopsis arida]|uniref:Glycosyl transferases group 1 n=1 Tax=Amycolatopsis arida TaxID=587909 RepID=A0A1I5XGB7_9PSEU|nr:glycosyltransferase [Amycolatopsis arida]TDX97472.1 glycosyl transferase family 1 [Amycolatopsis arida]SFQ31000.1 Glycosyl transferases group 1 [Amycolatopsis arida]